MRTGLQLHRPGPYHHCDRPSIFGFLADDVWRCPECGQRWRATQVQDGAMMWLKISFWQYLLGLGATW